MKSGRSLMNKKKNGSLRRKVSTLCRPRRRRLTRYSTDIDVAFHNAFLYALYQHKKDSPSLPNHGISFPIQPSYLISNLITPFLPIYSPPQAQYYQIKKTSWKSVKKLIKHLDKSQLVKSKDRSGGETVILDVDFNDTQVNEFVPYKLSPKPSAEKTAANKNPPTADRRDLWFGQTITVQSLYRPSGRLTPVLFPPLSNSDLKNYYTASAVSKQLNEYISSQDPSIISPSDPRIILLNPFISNTILNSSSPNDLATLARGTIPREALLKRLLEDPALCVPFHAILKPNQTLEDVKPKAGIVPKVTVIIERRGGF